MNFQSHFNIITDICRGRCAELISYWQFIGADKPSMADAYFNATKRMEEGLLYTLIALYDFFFVLGVQKQCPVLRA